MNHRNCGSCRWLMRQVNANGQPIKLTERNAHACAWPLPEIVLPISMTDTYRKNVWANLPRRRVMPQEGENCPTWELAT